MHMRPQFGPQNRQGNPNKQPGFLRVGSRWRYSRSWASNLFGLVKAKRGGGTGRGYPNTSPVFFGYGPREFFA